MRSSVTCEIMSTSTLSTCARDYRAFTNMVGFRRRGDLGVRCSPILVLRQMTRGSLILVINRCYRGGGLLSSQLEIAHRHIVDLGFRIFSAIIDFIFVEVLMSPFSKLVDSITAKVNVQCPAPREMRCAFALIVRYHSTKAGVLVSGNTIWSDISPLTSDFPA